MAQRWAGGSNSASVRAWWGEANVRETAWFTRLRRLAGLLSLTAATLRAIVTPPYIWRRDLVIQCWEMARICLVPVVLSGGFMQLAFLITAGQQLVLFGVGDRLSGIIATASVRETAPFVVGIVCAGVVGTSICADLGARKVREELDAMGVLGVDPVRALLAPRFLALVIVTLALAPIVYLAANLVSLAIDVSLFHVRPGSFFASLGANFSLVELVASLLKCALFGVVIAAVFIHAGMNASGGSEGVGRAVNRAVVAVFLILFVLNFTYNAIELAMFPQLQDLR